MPKTLVWDGEGAVGRWRARQPELTGDCQAFRGVLGTKVYICKPADPEAKGMLERLHDYLEKSFLPGRTFTSPEDFNIQLAEFFVRANARRMRVLGCTPGDRVATDRAAMMPLPPVPLQSCYAKAAVTCCARSPMRPPSRRSRSDRSASTTRSSDSSTR